MIGYTMVHYNLSFHQIGACVDDLSDVQLIFSCYNLIGQIHNMTQINFSWIKDLVLSYFTWIIALFLLYGVVYINWDSYSQV